MIEQKFWPIKQPKTWIFTKKIPDLEIQYYSFYKWILSNLISLLQSIPVYTFIYNNVYSITLNQSYPTFILMLNKATHFLKIANTNLKRDFCNVRRIPLQLRSITYDFPTPNPHKVWLKTHHHFSSYLMHSTYAFSLKMYDSTLFLLGHVIPN